jgi:hypothetical protein
MLDLAPRPRPKRARNRDGLIITDQWLDKDRPQTGNRWLYRVWDPRARRYKSKAFPSEPENSSRRVAGSEAGDEWAKDTLAKLRLGIDQCGRATLADLGAMYMDRARSMDRSAGRLRALQLTVDKAVAEGLNNLQDPTVPDRTQRWLSKLMASRHNQIDPKPATARTKNSYLLTLRTIVAFGVRRRMLPHTAFS